MTRVAVIDTDGLNPYGRCLVGGIRANIGSIAYFRRSAPVEQRDGRVFGPLRGAGGKRTVRALRLGAGLVSVSMRLRSVDVVHVLWETPFDAALALVAKYVWRARVVATIHDPTRTSRSNRIALWLLPRVADELVMHSTPLARRMRESPNITVVPLPHFDAFVTRYSRDEARAQLGLNGNRVVTFFGQLRPYKGVESFLDCGRRLAHTHPDVTFLIAGTLGDPALAPCLAEFAADLGSRVSLHVSKGHVPQETLDAAIAASDLIVLPFRQASQSASVVHALTHGRAVVTTAVGEVSSLAEHGAVELVPPHDVDALELRCRDLLDDPARTDALGIRARRYVDDVLDPVRIGKRLAALYGERQAD